MPELAVADHIQRIERDRDWKIAERHRRLEYDIAVMRSRVEQDDAKDRQHAETDIESWKAQA